ncbi:MAG: alanine--tRNA ligase [Deltaproteobacteria bacterium]|nr:alanine--tRNA ligase [Deltaproteobacteria bacterium]
MSAKEIRRSFLKYFEDHGHTVVRASSLVPHGDPTLMFTNAGMNQFKDVFTGKDVRPYKRATSAQKCMRVSGKHNDLENVGRTPRHHTFFEMLGNFSFGDYFKKEAIRFGWEWLTSKEKGLGLDPSRLWVTTFAPENGEPFPADEDADRIWLEDMGMASERLRHYGMKENFWSMGETGPCGPCSEIHLDHGGPCRLGKPESECGPACDCGRFVELWNLVFMQFNIDSKGAEPRALPAPCVDTGAGLERCTAAVQGVESNYDTDLFAGLILEAERISGRKLGDDPLMDVSMRVIADHARATAFLVADGVQPANEGRGYVLRRIMRRAIRHGHKLGIDELFLYRVALKVVEEMGGDYPELVEQKGFIEEVAKGEERVFRQTLVRGIRIFNQGIDNLAQGEKTIPGELVFTLKDTYGFPEDLTRIMADERGFEVDEHGFEKLLGQQRAMAGTDGIGEDSVSEMYHAVHKEHGDTEFLGYEQQACGASVLAVLESTGKAEHRSVQGAGQGAEVELVLDKTVFYGESGGQVGDTGTIFSEKGLKINVLDTKRPVHGLFVHYCRVEKGTVSVGDGVSLEIDTSRRWAIRRHHSATHLLHRALREVLGEHVRQKGSVVDPERLRFDYAQYSPPAREQLDHVELLVNRYIMENSQVDTEILPFDEAKARGAIALFEEKYGDVVRLVRMGGSRELCGGTHVSRTGDIGCFTITSEAAVASGVRRIEALAGEPAVRRNQERADALRDAAYKLKTDPSNLGQAVTRLKQERRFMEKEVERLERKLAAISSVMAVHKIGEAGGIKYLAVRSEARDPKSLREYGDKLRDKIGSGLIVTGSTDGQRVFLLAMATRDVAGEKVHAGEIIRELCKIVGGKGGGRPDMAQGGGSDPSKLDRALSEVGKLIESKTKT